jgi:hypothetical protein
VRVDQVRDVRMLEPREEAPLAAKPLLSRTADRGCVQDLDRGGAREAAVAALGQPDAPHPSLADERQQGVGPHRLTDERGGGESLNQPVLEKSLAAGGLVLGDQLLEVGRERWILAAERGDPGCSLLAAHVEGGVEVRAHGAPAVGAQIGHEDSCTGDRESTSEHATDQPGRSDRRTRWR